MCLHYHSGDEAYNNLFFELAKKRGALLSSNELNIGDRLVRVSSERMLYQLVGLSYIPIELREGETFLREAASGITFEDLIEPSHIIGMTHCHTLYSDGQNTVEEMAQAVKAMGKEYITITDHSPMAYYAGGVEPERLQKQWKEIIDTQNRLKFPILRGTESDILRDGSLDYDDNVLDQLDVIIASIHSRMRMDEEQMTDRLVQCMRRKQFKIWGHPLGRLILKREPIACRVDEVLNVAANCRAAIEVNGNPYRLDLEPKWLRVARKLKLNFIISTDAHSINDLNHLRYGVHLARRAGIRKGEVLNTLGVKEFCEAVRPKA